MIRNSFCAPRRVVILLAVAFFLACELQPVFTRPALAAEPVTLELLSQNAAITRLISRGAQGTNVNLQGSFDLETWFPISSGAVADGQAVLTLWG